MTQKHTLRGSVCTLVGGALWGFSGTCGQYIFANSSMSSSTVTAIRMLGSGILLLLYCLITRKKETFRIWTVPRDAARLLCFALFGLLFCQYAYLTAISYSNSGTATVLQYTGIILIMIVTCVMAKRLPRPREFAAVLLALFGVFLLATHGRPGSLVISRNGLLWGMLAAVAYLTYTMLPGHLLKKWGTPLINGYGMLIGGLVLSVTFRIWQEDWNYPPNIYLAIVAIVLLGTLLAFTLYLYGVSEIGGMRASMLACVEPVVAAVVSALWLHTPFTLMDIVGFAVILAGVLLVTAPEKKGRDE